MPIHPRAAPHQEQRTCAALSRLELDDVLFILGMVNLFALEKKFDR